MVGVKSEMINEEEPNPVAAAYDGVHADRVELIRDPYLNGILIVGSLG